jgi:hypothetical protein
MHVASLDVSEQAVSVELQLVQPSVGSDGRAAGHGAHGLEPAQIHWQADASEGQGLALESPLHSPATCHAVRVPASAATAVGAAEAARGGTCLASHFLRHPAPR